MFDAARVRERKQSKRKNKVSRRASAVTVTYMKPMRRTKRAAMISQEPIYVHENARADFADLKPDNVHPWDWHQLFDEDRELWPAIVEEAAHAAENGELQKYERRRHA